MPLDLEAFQKTQVYQRRATVAEVLEDLRAMEPQAQSALEARPEPASPQTNGMRSLGKGLLLASGVCLGALWLLPLDPRNGYYALLVFLSGNMGLGGVLALIVSWVGTKFGSPMETSTWPEKRFVDPYEEQRRLLLATLLQRFQLDLLDDTPVDVTLDLSFSLNPSKCVLAEEIHGKETREDFTNPWLSLQGRLADGTQLRLSVVDLVRMLQHTKNLPRQVKTGRKRRAVSLMQVALRVKPERHPGLAGLEKRTRDAVRLPSGSTLKWVLVAEDRLELRVLLDEDWVAQAPAPSEVPPGKARKAGAPKTDASRTATMMLLSLCQVLNHSSSQAQPGNVRSTS
ncbi:hypothetical protein [Corallococcus exercitus]|uniref:Uncharacterized protein n=1 Tax=Corallococcus exercitus TaxID=2316736 RepID=A0A7Y4ND81_9BACT|nr:hypothetical protein [Corallococcus exercitus]NOK09191.1 hypothetical protein [Corallococcus exercitus]